MKVGGGQASAISLVRSALEVGHVDDGAAAEQLGLDAEVVADQLLGHEIGVGRKAEEEPVQIAEARIFDAGADAGVHAEHVARHQVGAADVPGGEILGRAVLIVAHGRVQEQRLEVFAADLGG